MIFFYDILPCYFCLTDVSFSLDIRVGRLIHSGRNPTNAFGTGPSGTRTRQLQAEMWRHSSCKSTAAQSSTSTAATAATAVEKRRQPIVQLPNKWRPNQLLPVKRAKKITTNFNRRNECVGFILFFLIFFCLELYKLFISARVQLYILHYIHTY